MLIDTRRAAIEEVHSQSVYAFNERMTESTATSAAALAESVVSFLEVSPVHRSWVNSEQPLNRSVGIRSATWRPWLQDGGYPGRRGYCGPLPTDVAAAAAEILDGLPLAEEGGRRYDHCIDRSRLQELAIEAAQGGDKRDLIRLWVATQMWGSGTSNGRGPWRTSQGLASTNLTTLLVTTEAAVRAAQSYQDLGHAYRKFTLEGSGESFFTKWFWTVSLCERTLAFRPLILDYRVRWVLGRILRGRQEWFAQGGATRYCRYVRLMHEAAVLIADSCEHIDAEKLEWLLFDRPPRNAPHHHSTGEKCLAGRLSNQ